MDFRIGHGIDFHRLEKQESEQVLYLGGIQIFSFYRIVAHSDGDIILHALSDAILGALGEADIGTFFPDTDPDNKDLDSKKILQKCLELLMEKEYQIMNFDITIVAEEPKIQPYRNKIRNQLADLCKIHKERISIKATTTEKMGLIGEKKGIGCFATVLIAK